MKLLKIAFLFVFVMVTSIANKDKNDDPKVVFFDKGPILTTLADHFIFPNQKELKFRLETLSTAWNDFLGIQNTTTFDNVIGKFLLCSNQNQCAKTIDFGITMTKQFNMALGISQIDTIQIALNTSSRLYDLADEAEFVAGTDSSQTSTFSYLGNASNYLFHGIGTAGDSVGFDDYLVAFDRTEIKKTIRDQFTFLNVEIASWNDDLLQSIVSNRPTLDAYYNDMNSLVVNLKTDMPTVFDVVVTYQDTDGD